MFHANPGHALARREAIGRPSSALPNGQGQRFSGHVTIAANLADSNQSKAKGNKSVQITRLNDIHL